MATSSSSSVSSTNLQAKHGVFLNFRGDDTRHGFTSHLHEALRQKKIITFIDDKLKLGDEISPSLLNEIEGSKIAITIFSKDYASSRWCLEELVKIIECKNIHGQIVIPVFYHVYPSEVRNQTGSFGDGFAKLKERFKEQPEMVQRWKTALSQAANISGCSLNDNMPEAEIVKKIVDNILRSLRNIISPSTNKNLVGVESAMEELIKLLLNKDVCSLGIWGIGGIGKTTIARAIFNKISNEFEGSYFTENVREESRNPNGLVHLREKRFSSILGDQNPNMGRLGAMKTLIVLDDVTDFQQIEDLIEDYESLGSGSRVIITTRDKQVLENCNVDKIYESITDWESAISKLEETPPPKVYDLLKVSFDGLDEEEQDIFLDIACFFKWTDKDMVMKVLKASDLKVEYEISVLIDKSLITISSDNTITMHDLLQKMGRKIVREEKDIGKRSRLCHHKDLYDVLTKNTGTEIVRGICMDMFQIGEIHLNPLTFSNLHSLKFLKVYVAVNDKVHEFQELEFDFLELRYICWHNYRWKSLPRNFNPKNLVALEMRYSNLKELWSRVQPLINLKYIDLSYSKHLRKIAELSQASNLESLILEGCTSLIEIIFPSSRRLNNLVTLNLRNCKSLQSLPPGILQSNSLRFVNLSGCSNLRIAPRISCNIEQLCLDGTAIKKFSSTVEGPSRLVQFTLQNCSRLESLPTNFHKFESLKHLSLSSCTNLEAIPEIPHKIEEIYIDRIAIRELPLSIESLSNLHTLSLKNCSRIESLPDGILKLKSLKYLSLSGCSNIKTIPKISCKMEQLYLDETAIKELPSLIECQSSLVTLSLKNCSNLENLPGEFCNLKSLRHLYISGCWKLDRLPEDIGNLQSLEVFEADGIAATELPSSMESLSNIRELSFERCKGQDLVRSLPRVLSGLSFLKKLNLNECNMTELPNSLGDLSSLKDLNLSGNNFNSIPTTIINLSKLSSLNLSHCNMLQPLPNLPGNIQLLVADSCKSLQALSDLPIPSQGYFNGNLSFVNCFNLDWRMLTNILDYALSNMYEKTSYTRKRPTSYMCFRGSEIPDWFNVQSTASFLELPEGSLSHNFIGFTFCTVLSFQDYKAGTLVVECEMLLKSKDGLKKMGCGSFLAWTKEYAPSNVEFDHVFLGYDVQVDDKSEWDEFSEAIIKFRVTDYHRSPLDDCVVKKCGVRLLLSQEESVNESSLCLLSDEEDKEDEPQSK
ncbi:disease resistance-like protein DSC1 [Mangifera indica]|uniref:disease resistance-like protein DSC1 n=1 Tax=Mangifera indica TaxID=29780 RepID=UPI001CFBB324|nr:disease resistance-like protein DSC1 [Mangifera indica]